MCRRTRLPRRVAGGMLMLLLANASCSSKLVVRGLRECKTKDDSIMLLCGTGSHWPPSGMAPGACSGCFSAGEGDTSRGDYPSE